MIDNTKVIRGGSWYGINGRSLRCSCRSDNQPADRSNDVGFRVVGKMRRVLRGGSWLSYKYWNLRSSCRINFHPALRNSNTGFRLVGEEKKGKYGE